MTTSPISETAGDFIFVCECEQQARSACRGEPFYREHNEKEYCVLHFPGEGKTAEFKKALGRKLDHDFKGVWFPFDPEFSELVFTGPADFTGATFTTAGTFYRATFRLGAYFNRATFCVGATFERTTFEAGANFSGATFSKEKTDFNHASFNGEVDFTETSFGSPVTFYGTTFKDRVRFCGREGERMFGGNLPSLDLRTARIEHPERFSLRSLNARPSWFVHVDPRKFDFANIKWDLRSIKEEVGDLENRGVSSPLRMLEIACRQLAVNAEENGEYGDASRLRYMATDAHRRERWRGFELAILSWLYWLGSGYGERVWQAILVFFAILLLFALLYTQVGFATSEPKSTGENMAPVKPDKSGAPLEVPGALVYSAAVLTLQRPDPRPVTTLAKGLVLVETILGPVQAALLALAIRRKFMR